MTFPTHPGLLDSLSDFYPSTCTIQQFTTATSASGERTKTYADLASHVAIPCAVAPVRNARSESQEATQTFGLIVDRIALKGHYPNITTNMRAVVGSAVYDIIDVEHDQHSKTTYLTGNKVTV